VPGGGSCIAFRWDLSEALLDDLRAYGGIRSPSAVVSEKAADLVATVH
jgi:hypothetical protein